MTDAAAVLSRAGVDDLVAALIADGFTAAGTAGPHAHPPAARVVTTLIWRALCLPSMPTETSRMPFS